MTVSQWAAFITTCTLTDRWDELAASTDRKEAGYVNLYQVCNEYVKPWTRGTGNSIALLLNAGSPRQADLMISHAWGECIQETLVSVLARCSALGASLDTAIWFCTFAQYQPGDEPGDCGPTVGEQLALDPFKQVIASKPSGGMLVVHTSRAELYGRLWCVFEVNVAQSHNVCANAAMSMHYLGRTATRVEAQGQETLRVDTANAECWSKDDAEMIKEKVRQGGGFGPLNAEIFNFRSAALLASMNTFMAFKEWTETYKADSVANGETLNFLSNAVRAAGRFVGLHCLLGPVEAAGDEETCSRIIGEARDLALYFSGDGFSVPPGAPPPPMFHPERVGMIPTDLDDESVLCLLRGPEEGFGAKGSASMGCMMVGLLEMGAGGTADMKEGGVELDPLTHVKMAFRLWDKDGSGTIAEGELCEVLKQLNPSFTDEELQAMFEAADANRDGLVDFSEFVDWISASAS